MPQLILAIVLLVTFMIAHYRNKMKVQEITISKQQDQLRALSAAQGQAVSTDAAN